MTTEIKEFSQTEAGLATLEERYKEVPDASSKDGYEACRIGLAELRTTRTGLEKMRKNLNEDDQARIKFRNGEAKRITSRIVALEDPMKAAKKAVDDAAERAKQKKIEEEERRVAGIEAKVAAIHATGRDSYSASDISEALDLIKTVDVTDGYDEFQEAAQMAVDTVMATLQDRLNKALEAEKAQASAKIEQDRLNAERAELKAQQKEMADAQAKQDEAARIIREEQEEKDRIIREREQAIKDKELAEKLKKEHADRIEQERLEAQEADTKRKQQEELNRLKEIKRMAADKELFAGDAKTLLLMVDDLGVVKEEFSALSPQTETAKLEIEIAIKGLQISIDRIMECSVIASQSFTEEKKAV